MKKTLFINLILIILFLGCPDLLGEEEDTNGEIITPVIGRGLTITNFTNINRVLYPDETTEIRLNFRNEGEKTARNIYGLLYSYEPLEPIMNSTYRESLNPLVTGQLLFYWDLRAPRISPGQTIPISTNARLYYEYETTGYSSAVFIPRDYEGATGSIPESYSIGPFTVQAQSREFIRTIPDTETDFTMSLKINNIGDGSINYVNGTEYELNRNIIEIAEKANYLDLINISTPITWTGIDLELWNHEVIGDKNYYWISYDNSTGYGRLEADPENPDQGYCVRNNIKCGPESISFAGSLDDRNYDMESFRILTDNNNQTICTSPTYGSGKLLPDMSDDSQMICQMGSVTGYQFKLNTDGSVLCTCDEIDALISSKLRILRMIRSLEKTISLRFKRPAVTEETIERISMNIKYGYSIDTQRPISITVQSR